MTLSLPWMTQLFFITIRLGTLFLFTPIQAISQVPVHTRLLFIFIISMLLTHYAPATSTLDNNAVLIGGIAEFFNGLILSLSLYAAFAVFQSAGYIIDTELGLNSLTIFNPQEHAQEALTSRLLSMLAVLFFLNMDGHLWLFKGLALSFTLIHPGELALFKGFVPLIKQFGFMFTLTIMIASPIIVALLTIDLCSAVVTRTMPQMNTYFLILPIKIMFGFILLALMLHYLPALTHRVFESCFQTWRDMMS